MRHPAILVQLDNSDQRAVEYNALHHFISRLCPYNGSFCIGAAILLEVSYYESCPDSLACLDFHTLIGFIIVQNVPYAQFSRGIALVRHHASSSKAYPAFLLSWFPAGGSHFWRQSTRVSFRHHFTDATLSW